MHIVTPSELAPGIRFRRQPAVFFNEENEREGWRERKGEGMGSKNGGKFSINITLFKKFGIVSARQWRYSKNLSNKWTHSKLFQLESTTEQNYPVNVTIAFHVQWAVAHNEVDDLWVKIVGVQIVKNGYNIN